MSTGNSYRAVTSFFTSGHFPRWERCNDLRTPAKNTLYTQDACDSLCTCDLGKTIPGKSRVRSPVNYLVSSETSHRVESRAQRGSPPFPVPRQAEIALSASPRDNRAHRTRVVGADQRYRAYLKICFASFGLETGFPRVDHETKRSAVHRNCRGCVIKTSSETDRPCSVSSDNGEDNEESPQKYLVATTGSAARLFTRRIHTRVRREESRARERGIIYTQIGLIFGPFNAHYVKWVLFRTFVTAQGATCRGVLCVRFRRSFKQQLQYVIDYRVAVFASLALRSWPEKGKKKVRVQLAFMGCLIVGSLGLARSRTRAASV